MIKIGSCTLYNADCTDILPTVGKVDAIVTDPPYEFQTSGGGMFRRNRDNMDQIQEAGLDKGFDHSILASTNCDSCVVFCHNDQLPELLAYLKTQYMRFAVCTYHKTNPMPVANCHYQPDTEFYIHAWNKGFHPTGELREKKRYYFGLSGKDTDIDHPTVKPLPLMEKIIINTNARIICDPFMGSGTTGIACMRQGRVFIGIEKDKKYFDIACERIQREYDQPMLFPAVEQISLF
jgi:DNA modification methylase